MSHGRDHNAHNQHRSSERRFDRYITKIDNRPIGCRRLTCVRCGNPGEILDRTNGGMPPVMIEKLFRQKGWEIGASEKHDYCPDCVEIRRTERRASRVKPLNSTIIAAGKAFVVPSKPPITLPQQEPDMSAAPAPDNMTRDNRRIIFSKLQEVYADEAQGYHTPWTDQAVSKDLGCPLAWVIQIREENFGPAADNSEIRGMLARVEERAREAKALIDEVKTIRKDATAFVEKINDLCRRATEVGKNLDGLQATADRISQSVRL